MGGHDLITLVDWRFLFHFIEPMTQVSLINLYERRMAIGCMAHAPRHVCPFLGDGVRDLKINYYIILFQVKER